MNEFIENLIGRLEELRNDKYMNGVSRFTPNEKKVFDIAETIVNQLAEEYKGTISKTENAGWIPCSRELPPQPKENPAFDNRTLEIYLVSDSISDYPYRAFWNGKYWTDGFSNVEVIAWQPLPAPYQPKEGEL